MTPTTAGRCRLMLSGRPVSAILTNSRPFENHMLRHHAACHAAAGGTMRRDIVVVTRVCLELAIGILDGTDPPDRTAELEEAAANWARSGVPVAGIQHALHEGFKLGFNLVAEQATPADVDNLKQLTQRLFDVLDTVNAAVTHAYVWEVRGQAGDQNHAKQALFGALLAGRPNSALARAAGGVIAKTYHVVALAIPPHPDEEHPAFDGRVVAQRKLRRVQAAVARYGGCGALSRLTTSGGTILIPEAAVEDGDLAPVVTALSRRAQVPITATVVNACVQDLACAVEQAHQLLDLVSRQPGRHGLFRLDELALEYQLTRPGPGRDYLDALLDPLDPYPDLLETLRKHLDTDFDRRRTARALHVHVNTIDHRMKRVAQLIGLDPSDSGAVWYLRAAWIVRMYRDGR